MNALELMHKDHEALKEMLGRVDDVRSVGRQRSNIAMTGP